MAGSAVWIDILPNLSAFGTKLSGSATAAARDAGMKAGQAMAAGLASGMGQSPAQKMVDQLSAASKAAQRVVDQERQAIAKARAAEADATAKVVLAEQKLADARAKYGAESAQAEAADARLTAAKERQAAANIKTEATVGSLKSAYNEQKVVTDQLASAQAKLDDEQARQPSRWQQITGSVRTASTAISSASTGLLAVGAPLAAGVGYAVKAYSDFAGRMAQVQSLSHANASQMGVLRDAAMTMGSQFGQSANDVADAEAELIKAGIGVKDLMGGALKGALALAAAGQEDVGQAAETASIAMTQFKLSGSDIPHVADLLAAGADKALGSVGDLGFGLKQGGLVASQFGLNIDQTIATLSAFASAGLLGQDAGTSMKTMFLQLMNPTKQAQQQLDDLGISTHDAAGNFVSITDLAGQLQTKMGGLTAAQRGQAMATIFGSDALRAANILYANGAQGMQKWIDTVNEQGFAAEQAAGKMNSLQGDMTKLKNAFQTAMIDMGSSSDGFLRPVIQGATDAIHTFQAIPEPVKSIGFAIAGVGGVSLIALGGIAKLVTKFADFKTATESLGISTDKLNGKLKGTVTAGLSVAAAFTAARVAGTALESLDGTDKKLGISDATLNNIIKTKDVLSATSDITKNFSKDIHGTSFKDLFGQATGKDGLLWLYQGDQMLGKITGHSAALDVYQSKMQSVSSTLSNLVTSGGAPRATAQFASLNDAVGGGRANAQKLLDMMPSFRDSLVNQATAAGMSADKSTILNLALGKTQIAGQQAQAGGQAAAAGITAAGDASDAAQQRIDDFTKSNVKAAQSFFDSSQALQDASNGSHVSLTKFMDDLRNQVKAQQDWSTNMTMLAGHVSSTTLQYLQDMGASGTQLVAQLAHGSAAQMVQFDQLVTQQAAASSGAAAQSWLQTSDTLSQSLGGTTEKVDGQLRGLIGTIQSTPDHSVTISEPNSPWIVQRMIDLGFHVTHLPDGQILVTAPNIDAVNAALDNAARDRTVTLNFTMADTTTIGSPGYASTHPYSPNLTKITKATGGVLPGYTPGRDVYDFYSPGLNTSLSLSGGEAIMRPEWTKAVGGPAAVARMNASAKAGRGIGFADGGTWTVTDGGSYDRAIQAGQVQASQAMSAPSVGDSVTRWAGQVLTVLSMLGQSSSWLPTVLRRMNQESGGNPTVRNLWDSNAAAGTPSTGLMQVIAPTFRAYAGPMLNRGISDPLANIYAGLNYAIHRYGSLAALNRPGGYAVGGVWNPPTLYDAGGILPPGITPVVNASGKPEAVLTNQQMRAVTSTTPVTYQFEVHMEGTGNGLTDQQRARDAARQLAFDIRHSGVTR